jgi:N-acetylglucosamine kinase-like BadF-type ATPase
MTPEVILAVDGGQTSSRALVATRAGEVLGIGMGPACDHLHGPHGLERNRAAIHASARAALAAAGVPPERVIAVGLGLTSAPRGGASRPVFEAIVRELCAPRAIWVDSDCVSNLAGASGNAPGVVVIAGGGSIGYGVDATGRDAVAGGLGYLMGDEGSAWDIGLRALRAAARAADRRGPGTALLPMVLEHYRLGAIRELYDLLYDAGFTRDRVSTIAPLVVGLARNGDTVAGEIVGDAGRQLAGLALGVLRQLFPGGAAAPVFPTGGVFQAGDLVREPFRHALADGWPRAVVKEPRLPPVAGAWLKACDHAGVPVTPHLLDHLESTLPREPGSA